MKKLKAIISILVLSFIFCSTACINNTNPSQNDGSSSNSSSNQWDGGLNEDGTVDTPILG